MGHSIFCSLQFLKKAHFWKSRRRVSPSLLTTLGWIVGDHGVVGPVVEDDFVFKVAVAVDGLEPVLGALGRGREDGVDRDVDHGARGHVEAQLSHHSYVPVVMQGDLKLII